MQTTWRLTSSESTTDVKELIPEFFFLPEFLTNDEGFNFGLRQSGDPVDDVVLPTWAPDPRTFILVHRLFSIAVSYPCINKIIYNKLIFVQFFGRLSL